MLKVTVDSERDQVVIAFSERRQYLGLSIKWDRAGHPADTDAALEFARAVYQKALDAEDWAKAGGSRAVLGDDRGWTAGVVGEEIVVGFDPPGTTHKFPYEVAKQIADKVGYARVALFTKIQDREGIKYAEDHPELKDKPRL